MQAHPFAASLLAGSIVAGASLFAACGTDGGGNAGAGDDAGSGDATLTGDGGDNRGDAIAVVDGSVVSNYPCDGCGAFPPIGTPECAPGTLAPATIAYPLDGILFPPNMNVLEVQFTEPAGATLFEVDFENASTLVKVETKCSPITPVRGGANVGCGITLPQAAWNDIANINRDGDPLHVVVRATADGTCVASSTTSVNIAFAKEDIAGGIYYWQSATFGGIAGTTGGIYSHDFGSLDPTPTPFYTSGATGTCIGCHSLSRDGERMALASDDPDADDEFADVHSHVLDVGNRTVLGGNIVSPGFQTFTHDHAKMIASTYKFGQNLAFKVFDGDGTALLATNTLEFKATQPDLSRDDSTLVFVRPAEDTISNRGDHHFTGGSLYAASFDASTNLLGTPAEVLHSDGTRNFYYPSLSPNGAFLLFNDAPQPGNTATSNDDAFYNRNARVKLIHFPATAGATAIDLPALNVADGLTNSWPRWSPFVTTYKGHKLLWVTFSSNRDYGLHLANQGFDNGYPPESPDYDQPQPADKHGVNFAIWAEPQIWMAAIVVDEDPAADATDRSFPAFWLPFQDVSSHNHSAQWVEKIVTPPALDGGADGGTCAQQGAPCGTGPACCSDTICCVDTCQTTCIK